MDVEDAQSWDDPDLHVAPQTPIPVMPFDAGVAAEANQKSLAAQMQQLMLTMQQMQTAMSRMQEEMGMGPPVPPVKLDAEGSETDGELNEGVRTQKKTRLVRPRVLEK